MVFEEYLFKDDDMEELDYVDEEEDDLENEEPVAIINQEDLN